MSIVPKSFFLNLELLRSFRHVSPQGGKCKLYEEINANEYRPISLLDCSFKIFTKVLTNRFAKVANRLIYNCQSAFIRGTFILESFVTAHEVIHEVHNRKEKGLVLKIDYEKALI